MPSWLGVPCSIAFISASVAASFSSQMAASS